MAKKPENHLELAPEESSGPERSRDVSDSDVQGQRPHSKGLDKLLAALSASGLGSPGRGSSGVGASIQELDWAGRPWKGAATDYDTIWQRLLHRVGDAAQRVEDEQAATDDLVVSLLASPKSQRRVTVCLDRRFHSVTVCQDLLNRSWLACLENPVQAVELAELAVSVAAELASTDFPVPLVNDYKVRSWTYLGNARRILSDLRGAEKAFEMAESLLERSTGDPQEAGRFYELRAALSREAYRLDEADQFLAKARGLYRRAGSEQAQHRVRLSQASVANRRDQPARAIALLRQALPGLEPRLNLVAAHNLALYLSEMGDLPAARGALEEARDLHQKSGSSLDQARFDWLEGRLSLAEGAIDQAEAALLKARAIFVELQIGGDTALVSLDLAGVYARKGKAAEMRRLAEEVLPIFRSRDLDREIMAALLVLREASELEAATLHLIDELSSLLQAEEKGSDKASKP